MESASRSRAFSSREQAAMAAANKVQSAQDDIVRAFGAWLRCEAGEPDARMLRRFALSVSAHRALEQRAGLPTNRYWERHVER